MRALIALLALAMAFALGATPASAAALVITVPARAQAAADAPRAQSAVPTASSKRARYRAFSLQDEESVRAYYRGQPEPAAPAAPQKGAPKSASLGQPLPQDIVRTYLPLAVEAALPIYPNAGYYLIGRDVVLIDTTTRTVVDILKDVFG